MFSASHWLKAGKARNSRRSPRRRQRPQLLLEVLESRNLLSGRAPHNVNTDTVGLAQNETTIAVNPTDPRNLIGTANEYDTGETLPPVHVPIGYVQGHVTFNGGKTCLPERGRPGSGPRGDALGGWRHELDRARARGHGVGIVFRPW